MKMKYITGAVLTVLVGIFASCTDGNDWENDSSYAKEFRPKFDNVEVIEGAPSLKCFFTSYGGEYELQASTKSFPIKNGDEEVDEDDIVKMVAQGSPATITSLRPYTNYYLRLRAFSGGKAASNWINYASKDSVNKVVQTDGLHLLNPITDEADITSSSIRVTWQVVEGYTPTALIASYTNGDEEVVKIFTLDEAAVEAAEFTATDLQSSTKYSLKLAMGEASDYTFIGQQSAKTTKAPPKTDYTYTFTGTDFNQAVMDEIETNAKAVSGIDPENYTVAVVFPAGNVVNMIESNSSVVVPAGMSVYFFGNEGSTKATIKLPKILNVKGKHTTISFENVNLIEPDAGNQSYVINQPDAASSCNISTLRFASCFISNFGRGLVRHRYGNIDNIEISDCIVTGTNDYSLIQQEAAGFGTIEIDGSTFYNISTNLILDKTPSNDLESISITNSTFYNCFMTGKYWIDLKNKNTAKAEVVIDKVLVGHLNPVTSEDKCGKGIRAQASKVTVNNLYETNDVKWGGESDYVKKGAPGVTILEWDSNGIFANPAGNDFTLKHYLDAGDPRWKVEPSGGGDEE